MLGNEHFILSVVVTISHLSRDTQLHSDIMYLKFSEVKSYLGGVQWGKKYQKAPQKIHH